MDVRLTGENKEEMLDYSAKLKDYFLHPRNVGVMDDATVVGESGDKAAGQTLKFFLFVENDTIQRATFQSLGSPVTIAAAGALTELVVGKSLKDAAKIDTDAISEHLDGLPESRMFTAHMAIDALTHGLRILRGEATGNTDGEAYLCPCFKLTEAMVKESALAYGISNLAGFAHHTRAGSECDSCHPDLQKVLDDVNAEIAAKPKPITDRDRPATDLETMKLVQDILDREIRPGLAMDGGDMELVDIREGKVYVRLHGHCNSCASSASTMTYFVQDRLREYVDPDIEVIDMTEHSETLHAPPMR